MKRIPRWALGVGVIAMIVGVNVVLAFINFVTANPTSCLSCHGTGGTPDMSKVSAVHPPYNQVKCVDCHAKPGQYVLVEGYRGGFSADPDRTSAACVKCHSDVPSKTDTSGFKYDLLNISFSHKLHLGTVGALCTDCHQNIAHDSSPTPTNRPRMEYCFKCHSDANTQCTACHSKSIPTVSFSPIPFTRPATVSNGTPPTVPHSFDGRADCLACHQSGADGAPPIPASHAGRTNDLCRACHQQPTSGGSTTPTPSPSTPPAIPHSLDGRSACLVCHQTGVAGAPQVPASHAGRTNDMCQTCHKPSPPANTTAVPEPTTTPAPTTSAPTAPGSPPKVPHSLEGRSDCLVCHSTGLAGAPKVPDSHVGRTSAMCLLCHSQ